MIQFFGCLNSFKTFVYFLLGSLIFSIFKVVLLVFDLSFMPLSFYSFVIPSEPNEAKISHADILTRYLKRINDDIKGLTDQSPLFLWGRPGTGKFSNQPIGESTLKDVARKIADKLGLPDPSLYTSHSFRRSTATLAAEANVSADCMTVRFHFGSIHYKNLLFKALEFWSSLKHT